MDDATKKLILGIASGFLRKAAIAASAALTTHGIAVSGSFTETFVSAGIGLGVWAYSTYGDTVKVIVNAQVEVLKAKSLAQIAKLHANSIAVPDAHEVAAASAKSLDMATLSVDEVKKASATLPAAVAGTTALLALLIVLSVPAPALAQGPLARKVQQDLQAAAQRSDPNGANKSAPESGSALRQKILTDLSKPFQDLADFIGQDAEDAIALSTSIPGLQDGHGQQCWIMARNFTAVIKAHPLPLTGKGMSDLEAGRLLAASANQLCGDSHCTQVFTDLKNQAVILAQAGFGLLGATAVNAAPGLQDICNKVATVKMAEPVLPVPPAPVIASPK